MAKIRKLVEIGKAGQGVPVHHCSCTGTLLLLVGCTGTLLFMYWYTFASGGVYRYTTVHVLVHLPKIAQICFFLPLLLPIHSIQLL